MQLSENRAVQHFIIKYIQSLPGKWLEFNNFFVATFNTFKPSVITMQEIWNKPSHMDFDLTGYHPFNFTIWDKQGLNSNAGGGVGWIEKSCSFEHIDSISIFIPRVIEFLKIKNGKNKYTMIGNIYRPNSAVPKC